MKKNKNRMQNLAEATGLQYIETCNNWSGYPSGIEPAIIGFDTFEEAEEFARQHRLEVQKFEIRNGRSLWSRCGKIYGPIIINEDLFGDNYIVLSKEALKEFYDIEIRPRLGDFTNFDELEEFIKNQREIYDALYYMDNEDVVITYCGKYYDTEKEIAMSFDFDGTRITIGVA